MVDAWAAGVIGFVAGSAAGAAAAWILLGRRTVTPAAPEETRTTPAPKPEAAVQPELFPTEPKTEVKAALEASRSLVEQLESRYAGGRTAAPDEGEETTRKAKAKPKRRTR
jgi:hypothetical protein